MTVDDNQTSDALPNLTDTLNLNAEEPTEEALRKAIKLQEALFEGSRDGIFISDAESNFVAVNSAASELTGYNKEELLQMGIPDLHDEPDLKAFHQFHSRIMNGEKILSRAKILRKDGEKIDVEFSNSRIIIENTPYMHTTARDITERTETKKELQKSQETFHAFINSTPDLAFLKDDNLAYVMVNDAYLDFLGKDSREQVLGKTDFEILLEQLAKSCRESDQKAINEGKSVTVEEESDGQKFETRKFPVQLDNETIGVGGIIRSITERKRVEKALKKERKKLKQLHDAVDKLQKQDTEEEVMETAVDTAENILGFEICALDMVEEEFLVTKALSTDLSSDKTDKFKIGEGIAGKTFQNNETIWANDVKNHPEAKPTSSEYKSFISVPISDLGVFQVVSREVGAFTERDVELAEILAKHLSEELQRGRLEKELRQQAIKDPLTGLYNRRYFAETLQKEAQQAKRYDKSLAFIMTDINKFKEINDEYSHQIGDKVLQELADLLKENLRGSDTIIRYGGDEFLVMLPETREEAKHSLARLQKEISRWNKQCNLVDRDIEMAMGAACWRPDQDRDVEEALQEADKLMYQDKQR